MRARGGDLTAKSISSVGGLIEYLYSRVGTFNFFRRRDWDQDKAWLNFITFVRFLLSLGHFYMKNSDLSSVIYNLSSL